MMIVSAIARSAPRFPAAPVTQSDAPRGATRSTGRRNYPRRIGRELASRDRTSPARAMRALQDPGLSRFGIRDEETFTLEAAEKPRHLSVLGKQRRRIRIGQVGLRRDGHAARGRLADGAHSSSRRGSKVAYFPARGWSAAPSHALCSTLRHHELNSGCMQCDPLLSMAGSLTCAPHLAAADPDPAAWLLRISAAPGA